MSNSSSTSFLIVAKADFTPEALRRLMGVDDASPLAPMFEELYNDLLERTQIELDMSTMAPDEDLGPHLADGRTTLSEHVLERLNAERGHQVKAYFGRLDSGETPVQSFFCTDSFEEENDEIYINGLECAW